MISFFSLYTTVLSNYVDDNKLYAIGNDKEETKRALAEDFQTIISWLYKNYMVLNIGKCRYMCMGKDLEEKKLWKFRATKNSKEVEILGIKIDRK